MPGNEASFRVGVPRISGWQDSSRTAPENGQSGRQAFQRSARDFFPLICRSIWRAVLRVAKACLRDPSNSFFALKEVNKSLGQVSVILCSDAARRVEDRSEERRVGKEC